MYLVACKILSPIFVDRKFCDGCRRAYTYKDPQQTVERRVEDLLARLTTEEKARLLARITSYNVCYTKLLRVSSISACRSHR